MLYTRKLYIYTIPNTTLNFMMQDGRGLIFCWSWELHCWQRIFRYHFPYQWGSAVNQTVCRQVSLLRLFMSDRAHDDSQLCVFLSLIHLQLLRWTGLWSRKKRLNIMEGRREIRIFGFWIKSWCELNENEGWQSLHYNNVSTNTYHFAISWVNQHSFVNSETKYCHNECY